MSNMEKQLIWLDLQAMKIDAHRWRTQEAELKKATLLIQVIECTDKHANDSNLKNSAVDKLKAIVDSLD